MRRVVLILGVFVLIFGMVPLALGLTVPVEETTLEYHDRAEDYTISAGYYLYYWIKVSGKDYRIRFTTASSEATDTHLLDEENYEKASAGQKFQSIQSYKGTKSAGGTYDVPKAGTYYIVVNNTQTREVTVTIEVWVDLLTYRTPNYTYLYPGIGLAAAGGVTAIVGGVLKPPMPTYLPPPAYPPGPPPVAAPPVPPAAPTAPACLTCGQPLTYIHQYQRWYCQNCKKYA